MPRKLPPKAAREKRPSSVERGWQPDYGIDQAISDLMTARDRLRDARRRLDTAMACVPSALKREQRVMVGFHPSADGIASQPVFVSSPMDLDVTMANWRETLRAAGGTDDELETVALIHFLLTEDLNRDRQRLADASTAAGVPEAVAGFNEANDAKRAAISDLNRSRPETLAGAHRLAQFIVSQGRRGEDSGQAAFQLERSLAALAGYEHHFGLDA